MSETCGKCERSGVNLIACSRCVLTDESRIAELEDENTRLRSMVAGGTETLAMVNQQRDEARAELATHQKDRAVIAYRELEAERDNALAEVKRLRGEVELYKSMAEERHTAGVANRRTVRLLTAERDEARAEIKRLKEGE